MATFKISKDNQNNYYWIIKSDSNHKTISRSSESYETKKGAEESIAWMKKYVTGAKIEDTTINASTAKIIEALLNNYRK